MGAISPMHLILILAVALLVIGPGKLPETGAALGKAMREFRDAMNGIDEQPESVAGPDGSALVPAAATQQPESLSTLTSAAPAAPTPEAEAGVAIEREQA
jgi:sec-independent protein translocase protein TatA